MGEIAEMMLDGTLDCETGEYLGPGPGFPRTLGDGMPDGDEAGKVAAWKNPDHVAASAHEELAKAFGKPERVRAGMTLGKGQAKRIRAAMVFLEQHERLMQELDALDDGEDLF